MKNAFLLFIALVLMGCGAPSSIPPGPSVQPEATNADSDKAQADVEAEPERKPQQNPGQMEVVGDVVEQPEFGRMELVKVKAVDETYTTGPFNINVTKVSVVDFQPIDSVKPVVDNRDRATLVSIAMEVENTSSETLSIYPDQGTIVVGQEQRTANMFLSEQVGGDYIGEVVKEGTVLFLLNAEPENVSSIKYVVNPPNNGQLASVGDELTLEFDMEQ